MLQGASVQVPVRSTVRVSMGFMTLYCDGGDPSFPVALHASVARGWSSSMEKSSDTDSTVYNLSSVVEDTEQTTHRGIRMVIKLVSIGSPRLAGVSNGAQ